MLKWVYNRAKAMIRGNTIQGNHGSVYGGGLFVYQSGTVVHGNTIQDNNTLSGDGGGAFVAMSAVDFEANWGMPTTRLPWLPHHSEHAATQYPRGEPLVRSLDDPRYSVRPTFHIGPNSSAIDQGANAGVTTDIDGESRPNGAGYD